MNLALQRSPVRGLAALRRLGQPRPSVEHCELCGVAVAEGHRHLVDPEKRRLVCACEACAILFDHHGATRYRRVPRDIRALGGFEIGDMLWSRIGIPIGLVFFFRSSVSGRVLAVYPSPGGPAEIEVDEETWSQVTSLDHSPGTLEDDVEALLVNRIQGARDYFVAPIDECYKLTGVIRRHWTGFSGGDRLWEELRQFFVALQQRALPERGSNHA